MGEFFATISFAMERFRIHRTSFATVLDGNKSPDNLTGGRLITGVCFDPVSTPDNLMLWVTNGVQGVEHCPDWTLQSQPIERAESQQV